MILIHPDTWLEHWQERKKQKDSKEKITEQIQKGEPSKSRKILVECDDLFICVDA